MKLQLNGIQHYVFCPRQWAMITIEQVWEENEDTVIGGLVHAVADDKYYEETRKDKIFTRAVPISSNKLGLNGIIDVLEYRKSKSGIRLENREGYWIPYVVEYKKGKPKKDLSDTLQLVAQVMCLEEMFATRILKSAIYYKQINKRVEIIITDELREKVQFLTSEMQSLYEKGKTPKATIGKNCKRCSLNELCRPRLTHHKRSVSNYIKDSWEEIQ